MGNQQTALSGIHPFRDPNDPVTASEYSAPPPPPASKLIGFNPVVAQATVVQPEEEQQPKPFSEFDELFVLKPPTPPPRRNSSELPSRRRSLKGLFGGRNLSLKNLRLSRPDLNKLGTLLRWKKKKKVGEVYPVPPDAEKPSPPSRPEVFQEEDYFLVRWDRPGYDGGLPIIGYIIQHLELGLPQTDPDVEKDDTQSWYSSEPGQVTSTEVMLNNLIPGTTYIFRIIAENLLGYSQPGDTSIPIVFNPHGELDDWFCPPVFVIPLDESYTVLEHERVCLTVEITGQPYPLVKFYDRNDVELKRELDPLKYTITSCGQKRTLIISSAEVRDSGVIRVVGENEKGVVECSGMLVVEAPPRIRRIQKMDLLKAEENLSEEDQKLVQSEGKDEGVIFQSGELAKFKFIWSASPYPNICVYHDGDLVDGEETGGTGGRVKSQRVEVEITDNMIVVKIPNVQRSDRGEWTVRLDNVLGEDSVSVMLTVTDKPSRPGKVDVLQLSDNTVILKWAEPYDDGGVSTQGYIVEYFRSEWGVWLKACTVKNPYTKIRDLIPGSKYKFRVKAENLYGVSAASDESVELLITDLVSTLRSVGGDEATLLMKTVLEEEEEEAVKIEEEDPGSLMTMMMMSTTNSSDNNDKPTPPKRKLDRGSSNVSLNKVSSGTMTEFGGSGGGGGIKSDFNTMQFLKAPLQQQQPPSSSPQSSPKLLRVSLQPQVIVLDEPEEMLQPPEIQPRNRSPSPRLMNRNVIFEESEPNSREKSPVTMSVAPDPGPIAPPRSRSPISSVKTQISGTTLLLSSTTPLQRSVATEQQPLPPSPRSPIFPVVVQPISPDKKLYSRAEIIRSAATEDLDYFLSMTSTSEVEQTEEPEEDPELLKVKEALMNDELEDEEEYEYDFDQLQQEYEEDKKRGMVSRQDSGVSGRSMEEHQIISRGDSMAEEEEEDVGAKGGGGRAESVPAEVYVNPPSSSIVPRGDHDAMFRREAFERAQSEVVVRRQDGGRAGSGTFLHDRFTDYIAMKASSRNQRVGSSLRSLNSGSRYSSNEQLPPPNSSGSSSNMARDQTSKDSGRSSESSNVTGELKPFRVRSFNVEDELEGMEKLERSVSKASFRGTYDVISPQGGGIRAHFDNFKWRGVSAPDLGEEDKDSVKGGGRAGGCWGSKMLEHSRSEQFHDVVVPDSGLMARGIMEGGFMPGGVDSTTSGADEDDSRGEDGSLEIDLSLERDVPRERSFDGNNRRMMLCRGDSSSASEGVMLRSVDEELGGEHDFGEEVENLEEEEEHRDGFEQGIPEGRCVEYERLEEEDEEKGEVVCRTMDDYANEKQQHDFTDEQEKVEEEEQEHQEVLIVEDTNEFDEEKAKQDLVEKPEKEEDHDVKEEQLDSLEEQDIIQQEETKEEESRAFVEELEMDDEEGMEIMEDVQEPTSYNDDYEEEQPEEEEEEEDPYEEEQMHYEGEEEGIPCYEDEERLEDDRYQNIRGISIEDLKFKTLENIGELEFPEKSEHIDNLLSKLDKFLDENELIDEEEGGEAEEAQQDEQQPEDLGDEQKPGCSKNISDHVISVEFEKELDVEVNKEEKLKELEETEPGELSSKDVQQINETIAPTDGGGEVELVGEEVQEKHVEIEKDSTNEREVPIKENLKVEESPAEENMQQTIEEAILSTGDGEVVVEEDKVVDKQDIENSSSEATSSEPIIDSGVMEEEPAQGELEKSEVAIDLNEMTTPEEPTVAQADEVLETDSQVVSEPAVVQQQIKDRTNKEEEKDHEPDSQVLVSSGDVVGDPGKEPQSHPDKEPETTRLPSIEHTVTDDEHPQNVVECSEFQVRFEPEAEVTIDQTSEATTSKEYLKSSNADHEQPNIPTDSKTPDPPSAPVIIQERVVQLEAEPNSEAQVLVDESNSTNPVDIVHEIMELEFMGKNKGIDMHKISRPKRESPLHKRHESYPALSISSSPTSQPLKQRAGGGLVFQPHQSATTTTSNSTLPRSRSSSSSKSPHRPMTLSTSSLSSVDSLALSPVPEEQQQNQIKTLPMMVRPYAPDMSAYDRLGRSRSNVSSITTRTSLSRSTTRETTPAAAPSTPTSPITAATAAAPLLLLARSPSKSTALPLSPTTVPPFLSKLPSSPSSISSSRPTSPTSTSSTPLFTDTPVPLSEIHKRLEESRNQLIQQLIENEVKHLDEEQKSSSSSTQKTPATTTTTSTTQDEHISPFMTYLFNAAFYLMLSPMLLFVDSLYVALVCLLVVACVHFGLLHLCQSEANL